MGSNLVQPIFLLPHSLTSTQMRKMYETVVPALFIFVALSECITIIPSLFLSLYQTVQSPTSLLVGLRLWIYALCIRRHPTCDKNCSSVMYIYVNFHLN